jgi:hypothetical protein
MSNINFVLEALNQNIQMDVSGLLPGGEAPPALDVSATALYYVTVNAMRDAFTFSSDSRDVDNQNAEDIKYYVNWDASYVLNPAHAHVQVNAIATTDACGNIPSNRLLVKHDFIRHIAQNLFNTHLAVDLFENEQELKNDLATKGHAAWLNIKNKIDRVSNGGADAPDGYTTNALDGSSNLCRVLFRQLLNSNSHRLDDLDSLVFDASNNQFYIPFEAGDSVQFKVILKAAPGQESVIDGRTVPVPDRSYAIKISIVEPANLANVSVDDAGAALNNGTNLDNSAVVNKV